MKTRFWFLIFGLLFPFFNLSAQTTPAATIPDFKFIKLDSSSFSRNDLNKNQKTLLIFFDATCGHCQKSMQIFSNRHQELKDISVVLVSMDEKKSIDMFMDKYGEQLKTQSNVTILRDTAYQFVPLFRPKEYPSIYLYSENQELILYTSDDRKLDEVFRKIKEE